MLNEIKLELTKYHQIKGLEMDLATLEASTLGRKRLWVQSLVDESIQVVLISVKGISTCKICTSRDCRIIDSSMIR